MITAINSTRINTAYKSKEKSSNFKGRTNFLDKVGTKRSKKVDTSFLQATKNIRLFFLKRQRSKRYWQNQKVSDRDKNLKINQKILKLEPNSQNHIELGMQLQINHKHKESMPIFLKARQLVLKEDHDLNNNKTIVKMQSIKHGVRSYYHKKGNIAVAQFIDKLSIPEFAKTEFRT